MKNLSVFFVLILVSAGLVFSGTITVNQPNAQSEWKAGKSYWINWTANGCAGSNYKINIFKNSVSQANFKMQLTCSNVTTKKWKIPYSYKGNYIIRIKTDIQDDCMGDSAVFEVLETIVGLGVRNDDVLKIKKKPKFKPPKGMFKPVIESLLPVPLGEPLQPGGQLFLKGKKFGFQKGKILIMGNFPGGHIELENVTWVSDSKVNGYVPQSANGQPNQIVSVVVVSKLTFKSDPFGKPWFHGREEKVLTADAVKVNCGIDANGNRCNNYKKSEQGLDDPGCSNEFAICGWHYNVWGAWGSDHGNDYYYISLKNGWTFKSMKKVEWHKSSGDEIIWEPNPAFPAGEKVWNPFIGWFVTPNDEVKYRIKIIVDGPIGTTYK